MGTFFFPCSSKNSKKNRERRLLGNRERNKPSAKIKTPNKTLLSTNSRRVGLISETLSSSSSFLAFASSFQNCFPQFSHFPPHNSKVTTNQRCSVPFIRSLFSQKEEKNAGGVGATCPEESHSHNMYGLHGTHSMDKPIFVCVFFSSWTIQNRLRNGDDSRKWQ